MCFPDYSFTESRIPGKVARKHLLLALEINLVGSGVVQDVIAVLRD